VIYELKKECKQEDLQMIEPALLILFTRVVLYCAEWKIPCMVTSIISDRENVASVSTSSTHEEGRALDISTRGMTEQHIYRLVHIMNMEYRDIAAISAIDGQPRAAIYHDAGTGPHIHLQVRRDAPYYKYLTK